MAMLYIENYNNTEFVNETEVHKYLEHMLDFLNKYNNMEFWGRKHEVEKFDNHGNLKIWHEHLKNMIDELFNNFACGNFISATAMTRNLIECYVYFKILLDSQDEQLTEDWKICSLMKVAKIDSQLEDKILGAIKIYFDDIGKDYKEAYDKLHRNEKAWLADVIGKKSVTFNDACKYINDEIAYKDFKMASSFVHGQDILNKMLPFTFYESIYAKLLDMSLYIFKTMRLLDVSTEMENEMDKLELELFSLKEKLEM